MKSLERYGVTVEGTEEMGRLDKVNERVPE